MSLSPFPFLARRLNELHSWFVDIYNHLSAKNYDNKEYTPVITGMTGIPTVSGWYQRFGIGCELTITVVGTHAMSDAEITLPPVEPNGYGVAVVHSATDGSILVTGRIDPTSKKLHIKSYWVTEETVIIKGFYRVAGI